LLLAAATLVAYLPALSGQLSLMDDKALRDQQSAAALPAGTVANLVVPGATPQYYPLTFTSFWVDYHLWELNPLGYHW